MASFGGPLHLGAGVLFATAAVLALPGAAMCALVEWIGAKRPAPLWAGAAAGVAGLYCLATAVGLHVQAEAGWFWFPVPPLLTFALVSIVRQPAWRALAVWAVALVAFGLGVQRVLQGSSHNNFDMIGALAGGAFVSIACWQLAFWLRQRGLAHERRRSDVDTSPAGAPCDDAMANMASSNEVSHTAYRVLTRYATGIARRVRAGIERMPAGLAWFLCAAGIFYVGIGVLTAAGYDVLVEAMRALEWRIADFFGFRTSGLEGKPLSLWMTHGLGWSAIAGCGGWGAAASAGRFDAGSLQPLRFAAIVLCSVTLLAVLVTASGMRGL